MHKLAGRQTDPVKRAERDAAVVAHFLKYRSYFKTGQEFKLNRKTIGEILERTLAAELANVTIEDHEAS